MKFKYMLIFLVSAVFAFQAICLAQPMEKKSILLINSYHHGYPWSDKLKIGVERALKENGINAELHVEYLDQKRLGLKTNDQAFYDFFHNKYSTHDFDLIMALDNKAFEFAVEHQEALFKDVPIVFCGVNDFNPKSIEGRMVTGIIESIEVDKTLETALRLHPNTKEIIVIGDTSKTGKAIRNQVIKASKRLPANLKFTYWNNLPLNEIIKRLKHVPDDAIIYYTPFYHQENNRFYTPAQVQKLVRANTDRPIYSNWAFLIGSGSVGGKMNSAISHGAKAGQIAAKVLNGTDIRSIPVAQDYDAPYLFDYDQLQRFNLSEDLLPKGSRIINAPKAFYEISKELFWTILVSVLLLSLVIVLLFINILRRKKIETEIIRQLSFQETLMNTIPQLVFWKDTSQKYLGANRSFADFFGIDHPADVIGKTDMHLLEESRYIEWAAAMDREVIAKNKPVFRHKTKLSDKNGKDVWLEISKVPLYSASKVVGTLSTAENVTREILLEKQLIQSQKMEAIGALAGGIAHDFNNILTSIINSTELAMTDLDQDSDTATDLRRVLKAGSRGKRLVEQITAFSRPSQHGFKPTMVSDLVHDSITLLTPSLPRNITLETEIAKSECAAMVNPTQIYQIIMNLCTNAFQAMRRTGGKLTVLFRDDHLSPDQARALNIIPGPCFVLAIADNGPGIAQSILDKIFDPFFTTKDKNEGTGLGLALVMGIVKNHKGAIRVSSLPGEKTEFEIHIPINKCPKPKETAPLRESLPMEAKIIFVEDDPDQLETTPRTLRNLGFEVQAADRAKKAVELLGTGEKFDLVITDYDMPEMNGIELADILEKTNPGLPVVLVSGRSHALKESEKVANIKVVLAKPFNREQLAQAVRTALMEKEVEI